MREKEDEEEERLTGGGTQWRHLVEALSGGT